MFRCISNRYRNKKNNSNKTRPKFRNLKVKNKENLRLSNHNSNKTNRRTSNVRNNISNHNNINQRFSNPRGNSNRNNSILNHGGSNRRGNHNTNSLKKNLREGMLNIESKGDQ